MQRLKELLLHLDNRINSTSAQMKAIGEQALRHGQLMEVKQMVAGEYFTYLENIKGGINNLDKFVAGGLEWNREVSENNRENFYVAEVPEKFRSLFDNNEWLRRPMVDVNSNMLFTINVLAEVGKDGREDVKQMVVETKEAIIDRAARLNLSFYEGDLPEPDLLVFQSKLKEYHRDTQSQAESKDWKAGFWQSHSLELMPIEVRSDFKMYIEWYERLRNMGLDLSKDAFRRKFADGSVQQMMVDHLLWCRHQVKQLQAGRFYASSAAEDGVKDEVYKKAKRKVILGHLDVVADELYQYFSNFSNREVVLKDPENRYEGIVTARDVLVTMVTSEAHLAGVCQATKKILKEK
jgi:hypothetical protein